MTNNFKCTMCESPNHFNLNEEEYSIRCGRCGAYYKIVDVSSGEPLWVGKTGKAIRISKMDDEHLNNSIALLIRKPNARPGSLEKLIDELERRREKENVQ